MKFVSVFIFSISIVFLLADCHSSKKSTSSSKSNLAGTWELAYITGPRITFDGLYPEKRPLLNFSSTDNNVSGNTSCNGWWSTVDVNEEAMKFSPVFTTKIFCEGAGEPTFLQMLEKVKNYTLEGNTLSLKEGELLLMKFIRK